MGSWEQGEQCTVRNEYNPKVHAMSSKRTSVVEARFLGAWGPASISENSLAWNEGESVKIDVVNEKQLSMTYFNRYGSLETFFAELRADGRLHWNDGDVWSRGNVFPSWKQREQCRDESLACSRRDSVNLEEAAVSERQLDQTAEESSAIVSSNVPEVQKILPPWLATRQRKTYRSAILPSRTGELADANARGVRDPQLKQAEGAKHATKNTSYTYLNKSLVCIDSAQARTSTHPVSAPAH